MMTLRQFSRLCLIPLLVTACGTETAADPAPKPTIETVTSEEVRLSDLGQSKQKLTQGRTYRVVGRIRNIQANPDGSPSITFTGLVIKVPKGKELATVKQMKPDDFIAAECKLLGVQSGIFPEMTDCGNLAFVTTLSAEDYEATYADNVFNADDELKDKPLVIFGNVRLVAKLTSGEDYVALEAQPGFSDVTAIVAPSNRALISSYAKPNALAMMYCTGGHRYNQMGSIGVTNCQFLQNY